MTVMTTWYREAPDVKPGEIAKVLMYFEEDKRVLYGEYVDPSKPNNTAGWFIYNSTGPGRDGECRPPDWWTYAPELPNKAGVVDVEEPVVEPHKPGFEPTW